MATRVSFDKIWDYDKKTRIFRTSSGHSLWIKSFENGIATADPMGSCTITSYAEMIAGCFDEDSNFTSELLRAFDCETDTNFIGIQFEFNCVMILVTKENADKDKIYAEWNAGMKANAEKYLEAYRKTPEYRKQLKAKFRKETVEKKVLAIDKSTELEFKDDESKSIWEKWVEIKSKNDYGLLVVAYARRWAKYMQHLMSKYNKTLSQIAYETSYVSDINGIADYSYDCVVDILSQCWKYGEELRRWHSGQED